MKTKNLIYVFLFVAAMIVPVFAQLGGSAICHCGDEESSEGTYLYVVEGNDCCRSAYGGAVNFVWEEQYPGVWGSTPANQHSITGEQAMAACCD